MKIVFATNNRHKLKEVKQILGDRYTIATPRQCGIAEDIPETGDTLEANALQKARYVFSRTGENCFADDTGLEVEALDGAPGVRSARYAGDGRDSRANMELLLDNMTGRKDRGARFRTVIALIMDGEEHLFEGEVRGAIAEHAAGDDGFGYDPVFVPEGCFATFAEMSPEGKNRISHRARAVEKLSEFLRRDDQEHGPR